jgi:DNA-binding NtrC family response regulator
MQPVAKVLSVGLSDLVSPGNASLRRAGFQVVAATCLEEACEACQSWLFDVVVVGHTLSDRVKALLLRRVKADFHLPVVLITGGPFLHCDRADAYIRADAPAEDLFQAITQLTAQSAGQQLLKGFEELADQDLGGHQETEAIGEPLAVGSRQ